MTNQTYPFLGIPPDSLPVDEVSEQLGIEPHHIREVIENYINPIEEDTILIAKPVVDNVFCILDELKANVDEDLGAALSLVMQPSVALGGVAPIKAAKSDTQTGNAVSVIDRCTQAGERFA